MYVEDQPSIIATDPNDQFSNEISISFENVELTENHPRSEAVGFLIEKRPIKIEDGKTYGVPSGVLIDENTPEAMEIATQAEAIKTIPEIERPSKLMELLRSNLQYAYPDSIDNLALVDKERAEWIRNNIIGNPSEVKLSEVLSSGYGICRHLSVVYLWLAQKAGLEGTLAKSDPAFPIQNIERIDNQAPLFKLTEVGKNAPAHTWVELKLSTGEWIPVDPSTNLIGNTREGLEMFKMANYRAVVYDLEADVAQEDRVATSFTPTFYETGAAITKSSICAEILRHINFTTGERSVSPYSGKVDIRIHNKQDYLDSRSSIKKL